MAFIGASSLHRYEPNVWPSSKKLATSSRSAPQCSANPSRRQVLHFLWAGVGAASVGTLPLDGVARSAEELPGLPAGAREFSRLIAARKQWSELRAVLTSGRELDDKEWEGLRTYLRAIYQTTADMEYLSKPWGKELRAKGNEKIKSLRQTVKGMDKPAAAKDVKRFAEMHAEAVEEFDGFFEVLREASTGGIPEEL